MAAGAATGRTAAPAGGSAGPDGAGGPHRDGFPAPRRHRAGPRRGGLVGRRLPAIFAGRPGPARPGSPATSGTAFRATGPPVPPRAPRRPSAQGYGVPPGELTQPIAIFQPQAALVADAYRAADDYDEDALAETAYAPQPVLRDGTTARERPAAAGTSLVRSTGSWRWAR